MEITESAIKKGKILYILEAMLEYLIAILVSGSFLATLTKELGFSDSLTGILSSIISLGCLFQLLSIALRRRRVKSIVVTLSIINQLLFMLLYIIPFFDISKGFKIAIFTASVFLAYLIYNFAHPKKINWLMSLVDDSERGDFTANKEIISLIVGMVFSYVCGAVTDSFKDNGNIKTAFIILAAVMFLLMTLHTLSMVFTVEKEMPQDNKVSLTENVKDIIKNKNILRVTVVFVIYYIGNYASVPFYGTYQINELAFSLKFVSILTIFSSIVRILVSKFWGRYADKKSFANMIEKCFLILAISYICVIFSVPSNGRIMFILYYAFHGCAMGGINSALTNMIFDYTSYEKRSDSLAVCQAVAGTVGFVTTLLVSPLVSHIQSSNNSIFGINIYAQQVVSIIGLLFTVIAVLYVRKYLKQKKV